MKTDRLISIIMVLLNHDKISAGKLAEMFEVSRRTIYRDLESIELAGVPIVTEPGINGGISIMKQYKVDKRVFTSDDLQKLMIGLNSVSNALSASELTGILEKIKGLIPAEQAQKIEQFAEKISIDVAPWISNKDYRQILNIIRDAFEKNRLITFGYMDSNGEVSSRKVEPYKLVSKAGNWYMQAYCTMRNDYRTFKLSRMTDVAMLGETFTYRDDKPARIGFEPDTRNKLTQVRLLIHASQRGYLTEVFGELKFTPYEADKFITEIPFMEDNYCYGIILSMGIWCECISPQHIREEVVRRIKTMLSQYEPC